ncbi:hypothetical protein SAMN04487967_0245 [Natronorubrum sediminis]|uniref:Uncharacterized protein n=2 Tax=Natronorubrum sediminis TaxID=640943 RepID=A0A1H6FN63_9EURY|nr:hypothetical protein SAMN04487967_0245 [Natronorubrum sediminis]
MENTITQKQILPHLNRNFGFSELSTDSTLKPATNVFLKTLEAAGYGNYVVGRGGNPTRLEVQESLLNIQQEVDQDLDENPAEGSEDRAEIEQPTLEDSATEIIQQKEAKEEEETKQDKEVSFEEDVVAEPSIKKPEQDPNTDLIEISEQIEQDSSIDLQINIEISSSDWESESVIALIEKLQSK